MTGGDEPVLQLRPVLDDPVVYDREPIGAVTVRMSIARGGPAMGSPTGVSDTGGAGVAVALLDGLLQLGDPPRPPSNADAVFIQDRHPGGVVAPVLQPLQPMQQHLEGRARAGIADDAAHTATSFW